MFEVLVFVYENYWHGDECPEPLALERKLQAVGFEAEEIQEALIWLDELNPGTPHAELWAASPASMRLYSVAEQNHLGAQCLGFIHFLETSGKLPAHLREMVMERAMAACADPVLTLEDLKTIILMVYWCVGEEPDALVQDELCDVNVRRIAH